LKKYLLQIILAINCVILCAPSFARDPSVSMPSVAPSVPFPAAVKAASMPSASMPSVAASTLPDAHPTVTHGSLNIKTSGTSMDMHAGAGKTIANFNGFNIGSAGKVTVNMGDSDAMLARDVSGDTTHIMGELNVPQGVFALQGQEIVMHNGAVLNIGEMASFVGVAGHVTDESFLSGNMAMTGTGTIYNAAQVNIKEKGFFGLFGRSVTQTGRIAGKLSTVALSAGEEATLSFDNELVGLVLPDKKSAKPGSIYVEKDAKIETNGGNIYITAQAAAATVESVVRVDGVVRASAAHKVGGKIILGGPADRVDVSGTVESTGDKAGDIIVGGRKIDIAPTARFDTSGQTRAGLIQIGGRRIRNGIDPLLWQTADVTADTIEIQKGAEILSRRYGDGRAGDIFVIAREGLNVKGAKFDVRSWGKGDGGFLELSVLKGKASFNDLDMSRVLFENYDETARAAQLLFDPETLTVGVDITSAAIQTALAQGDVLLRAEQGVTVSSDIEWSSRYSLVLAATNADPVAGEILLEGHPPPPPGGVISIQARIEMLGSTGKLLLWQGAGTETQPVQVVNVGAGGSIVGASADNYVLYSVPQPKNGVDYSSPLEGLINITSQRVVRPTVGDDNALIAAIRTGTVEGIPGVHADRDIIVPSAGNDNMRDILNNEYNLTSFNTDKGGFTTQDDATGFYRGAGSSIGRNTITLGGVDDTIQLFRTMEATARLTFLDLNFPGLFSGDGGISHSIDAGHALFMDKVNLTMAGLSVPVTNNIAAIVGNTAAGSNVYLRDITGSIGDVSAGSGVSLFVGDNAGAVTIDNVELSIGNITGSENVGLVAGRNTGEINISGLTINGTPIVGQAGATNTGLLVGDQSGAFFASDVFIDGATVTGNAGSSAGLYGNLGYGITTLADFRIRSLTAAGLNIIRGSGTVPVEFSGLTQIMGVTADSFDSTAATWAEGSHGAISGQLENLPAGLIDGFPGDVLLRFFNGSNDDPLTFYQLGGVVPELDAGYNFSIDDNTLLNILPQESATLPFSVIQFGTLDEESEVVYETFRYVAADDQAAYVYDSDTTTLVEAAEEIETDTGTGTGTGTGTDTVAEVEVETEDPSLSSDEELVNNYGEDAVEEDLPIDDDFEDPLEEEVNDEESGADDLEEDTGAEDSEGDDSETDEDEQEQKKRNARRRGGDILSLLEDKDGNDIPDVSDILRQGA